MEESFGDLSGEETGKDSSEEEPKRHDEKDNLIITRLKTKMKSF